MLTAKGLMNLVLFGGNRKETLARIQEALDAEQHWIVRSSEVTCVVQAASEEKAIKKVGIGGFAIKLKDSWVAPVYNEPCFLCFVGEDKYLVEASNEHQARRKMHEEGHINIRVQRIRGVLDGRASQTDC